MTRGLALVLASGLWLAVPVMFAMGCGDDSADDDADAHTEEGDHHAGEHDKDIGPDSEATCPDDPTLTYDNFGKEFFAKYCNGCHSKSVTGAARMMAPADHNFDTLEQIELFKKHIDQYAAAGAQRTNTHMPPEGSPKPTLEERKKLGEWLACGPE